jgi:hypothetical protein
VVKPPSLEIASLDAGFYRQNYLNKEPGSNFFQT